MPETKRRTKKENQPPAETAAPPGRPGPTRVTLTKDVSSRYRKLVPRARPGGAAPARPPRSKGLAARPERGAPSQPPRRNDPGQGHGGHTKPPRRHDSGPGHGGGHTKPPRRNEPGPERGGRTSRNHPGPGGGPKPGGGPGPLKALLQRELPEMAKQLRETQDLLRTTAEEMLNIWEEWSGRPAEETRDPETLVSALLAKMSFQDLAGQRLNKVENFLKALAEAGRPAAPAGRFPPRRPKPGSKADQAEGGAAKTGPHRAKPPVSEGSALKGPQAAGGGLDQGEIEALMSDLIRQADTETYD